MDQETLKKPIEYKYNLQKQSLYSDITHFCGREDNTCILSFGSVLPVKDGNGTSAVVSEQTRIIITKDHARKIVDILTEHLDYYPSKSKKSMVAKEIVDKLLTEKKPKK